MLTDALLWIGNHRQEFFRALGEHLTMSAVSLAIGLAIGLPLAVAVMKRERLALAVINTVNSFRTIPSLAILAIMLPLFGIGLWSSVVALTILAIPPILINAYTGLRNVDPDAVDAATGLGMRPRQMLWRIQLPLAAPAIFAGTRTAAIQVLAGATLAPFIGGGGLGDFITAGIGLMDMSRLLVGAVPIALLALGAELGFGMVERALFGARAVKA